MRSQLLLVTADYALGDHVVVVKTDVLVVGVLLEHRESLTTSSPPVLRIQRLLSPWEVALFHRLYLNLSEVFLIQNAGNLVIALDQLIISLEVLNILLVNFIQLAVLNSVVSLVFFLLLLEQMSIQPVAVHEPPLVTGLESLRILFAPLLVVQVIIEFVVLDNKHCASDFYYVVNF